MKSIRTYCIFTGLFISSLSFARWSAVEKVNRQDIVQNQGGLNRGRSLTVDFAGNKHLVCLRDTLSNGDRQWYYNYKQNIYFWDNWNDTIFYTAVGQNDFPPYLHSNIITDVTNRCHFAWATINSGDGDSGYVYYGRRLPNGTWDVLKTISPKERQPADVAIAVSSVGGRAIIVYSCIGPSAIPVLKGYVTTNSGVTWTSLGTISDWVVNTDVPSVAVDEVGYFYIVYFDRTTSTLYCDLRDFNTFASLWKYNLGGVTGQCCEDPSNGNIHFANIKDGNIIYRWRSNGDSNPVNWFNIDTLLTGSTSQQASISAYNSVVGVVSGANFERDTLYFERRAGVWDTTILPRWAGHIYSGKCVAIDNGGYAHIDGNIEVSGASTIISDSVFYFTNKISACIKIIPDTIAIPDTGGWTYPGTPIQYRHFIVNCGNIIDSFGVYISTPPEAGQIDSVGLRYRGVMTYYPDTLWIRNIWPVDTDTVFLRIVPSDTCEVCYLDSTQFIGYSVADLAVRDSALDTTRIRIRVDLSKTAMSPSQATLVNPGDTITYRIVLADTWNVFIDSLVVYDPIDTTFDTVWVDYMTRPSDNYYNFVYGPPQILRWIIKNMPGLSADTLILKGIVKDFDCDETLPPSINNLAYTPGTPCILSDTSLLITHQLDTLRTTLQIEKAADHPDFDTLAPGDILEYYIKCKNIGKYFTRNLEIIDNLDDDIARVIYVSPADSDAVLSTVTWKRDCLLAGDSLCCTLRVEVGKEFKMHIERLDTLFNSVRARGEQAPNWVYSDTTVHYIRRTLDVFGSKTAIPVTRSTVYPGDSIFYQVIFWNDTSANSIMRDDTLIDMIDPLLTSVSGATPTPITSYPVIKWHIDSLAPGDSFVGTYWGHISNTATPDDSIRNWFKIRYPPYLDSATSISDTTVHFIGIEDILKTSDPVTGSWVAVGDTIDYRIRYWNWTKDTIYNVLIKDTLDTFHLEILSTTPVADSIARKVIFWDIGNIAPDDTFTVYYTARVKRGMPGDSIPNLVTFRGKDASPDTGKTIHHITATPRPSKTCVPSNRSIVNPGEIINYKLVVNNTAAAPAFNVVIKDTVTNITSATTTFVTHGNTSWTPVGTGRELTWTIDTILPGTLDSCTYQVTVANAIGDSVVNFAVNRDSISNRTVHPIRIWNININKDAYPPHPDSSVVLSPDTIYYRIRVTNTGGDTAHNVTIWDVIDTTLIETAINISSNPPTSYTYNGRDSIIWTFPVINPPAQTVTLSYDGIVRGSLTSGTIINKARVTWTDVPTDTFSDSTFHYIVQDRFHKSSVPPSGTIVRPGDLIWFYLTCTAGARDTAIVLIDTLSDLLVVPPITVLGDSWFFNPADSSITWWLWLPAGQSATVGYRTSVVDSNLIAGDTIINYGWFISPDTIMISDSTRHPIGLPNVNLLKTAVPPSGSYVTAGDVISYTLTCSNTGTDTARNIIVRDTLSKYFVGPVTDVVTWSIPILAPGATAIDTFIRLIRNPLDDTAYGDTVWNRAWLSSTDPDVAPKSDTTFHPIRRATFNLSNKRSFIQPSGNLLPEYSVVTPGDIFDYEIKFKSTGPTTARNVILTDTIKNSHNCVHIDTIAGMNPGTVITSFNQNVISWQIASIDSGDSVIARFRVTVSNPVTKQPISDTIDTLRNTYWVTSNNTLPDTSNVHILYVVTMIDFDVTKWADPASGTNVDPGDTIDYFISYHNTGNSSAQNVVVTDTIWGANYQVISGSISNGGIFTNSKVTWSLGTVPANYWDTLTFSAIVGNLKHIVDTLYDSAYLYGRVGDISKIWNGNETHHFILNTDAILEKISNYDAAGDTVIPGDTITYTIRVINTGQASLQQVILRDSIWGEYSQLIGHLPEWTFPSIAPNDTEIVTYRAVVNDISYYGLSKNIVDTVLGTIYNKCVMFANNHRDTLVDSLRHYVVMRYGVEIAPDTVGLDSVFVNESAVCNLTVTNTGDFTDSIRVDGYAFNPGWGVTLQGTTNSSYIFPNVPADSSRILSVRIHAPATPLLCDTIMVIANSIKVRRINKFVADTSIIFRCSRLRQINILVEPDTSATTRGNSVPYNLRVINNGNDTDIIDIAVAKINNGWIYALTHQDGTPLLDTDTDGCIDVGKVAPYGGILPLRLLVTPPPNLMTGVNITLADTLVIWGTSSILTTLKDSARVITSALNLDFDIHNYPNPFERDDGTRFIFILPEDEFCTLIILNRKGELIKTLFDKQGFSMGRHEIFWNSTNEAGVKVAAGTYIYMFKTKDKTITKKLTVLPERH